MGNATWFMKMMSLPTAWYLYAQAMPDASSWTRVIESFGLPIALVCFFMWQWYIDKTIALKRIAKLEGFHETMIEKDVAAREQLVVALASIIETNREFIREFKALPCALKHEGELDAH